ncbi:MAG: hypothetical protein ACLFU0_04470 [Alphaproteobacteria bacterium]
MRSPTSTIVIDLAALGVLADGPSAVDTLCGHVQAACRPWLTPTRCVVCDRLIAWIERGVVEQRADGGVALTAAGRDQLKALVAAPVGESCQSLLPLVETLKLALADQLTPPQRQALLHELVQLRSRCLAAQTGTGDGEPTPTLLRRCAARRLHAAALAEVALGRAMAQLGVDDAAETTV